MEKKTYPLNLLKNLVTFKNMSVSILTYHRQYTSEIASLILSIQRNEFNVPITLADQPDLSDIENFYQKGNGNFWCALNAEEKVIGTIALIDIGHQCGVIRKMFVHTDYRGGETKTGQQLLNTLEQWAKEKNMQSIYLGTIDRLLAANRFYKRNGYEQIEESLLPSYFPKMKVDNTFFRKVLKSK
jgi:N-acetylglutamate synthase-like GNAT family acetyltransferase